VSGEAEDRLSRRYRELAKLVHPDKNPANRKAAEELFVRLEQFRDDGEKLCQPTAAPKEPEFQPITFSTKKATYTALARIASGGMRGIFEGIVQLKGGAAVPVILVVPHSPDDNDLMEREAKALKSLQAKVKDLGKDATGKDIAEKFLMRIPTLLESIKLEEPGVKKAKTVNVFAVTKGYTTGWYTLEEIQRVYPNGVSPRVMCFIWNRILEGLTLAHAAGITHGAITPNHVIIQAAEHLGNILDWTAATSAGEKVPWVDDRYAAFQPEELIHGRMPSPATDIYMSAWCMVYLLGGDPTGREIPNTVPEPIREFLNKCLQPNRRLRPPDAATAYTQFRQVSEAVFGKRTFVGLAMPPRYAS
jgi:hypothetical protein